MFSSKFVFDVVSLFFILSNIIKMYVSDLKYNFNADICYCRHIYQQAIFWA